MGRQQVLVICLLVCESVVALTNIPFADTNSVVLKYDAAIPVEVQRAISNDFVCCLEPMSGNRRVFCNSDNPDDIYYWLKLWQPYGVSTFSNQGPCFPEYGTPSNDTFTIDIDYSFATNHAQRLLSLLPYSNEMAQAYTFLALLSPTNLLSRTEDELLGLYLWKETQPGQSPIPEDRRPIEAQKMRSSSFYQPPVFAFHVWDVGPTNNPPYLWCEVPELDSPGKIGHNSMIYFQGKWWFSEWPYYPGEQQW